MFDRFYESKIMKFIRKNFLVGVILVPSIYNLFYPNGNELTGYRWLFLGLPIAFFSRRIFMQIQQDSYHEKESGFAKENAKYIRLLVVYFIGIIVGAFLFDLSFEG